MARLAVGLSITLPTASATGAAQRLERPAPPRALPADEIEILDGRSRPGGLDCDVRFTKPSLGFDFRFGGVLSVTIPLSQLGTQGGDITVAARLRNQRDKVKPALFRQVSAAIDPSDVVGAKRVQVVLHFTVGEGAYQLDWMIRNETERGCSGRRRFAARLKGREKQVRMRIGPGEATFYLSESFGFEPIASAPESKRPLHLKLLLNLPPFKDFGRRLYSVDWHRMVSILREIADHPRVGTLDVVAFNLKDQRVIYSERDAGFVDYPALFRAVQELDNALVNADALRTGADTEFLARLLTQELTAAESVDGVIVVGPFLDIRRELNRRVMQEALRHPPATFYLRYRFRPAGANWGDSITPFVDWVDGKVFSIYRPVDLWSSVEKIVGEIDR